MLQWLIAASIGLGIAVLQYGWREPRAGARAAWPAALRALALALLLALILGAPAGPRRERLPLVVLDASASWLRGGDTTAWRTATDRARASGADSVFLVGDSLRAGALPLRPSDRQSRVRPAIDRALAAGRPLILITDGEVADPEAAAALPSRSRIEVVARPAAPDAALITLELPRAAVGGDTVEARLVVAAGSAGAPGGTVTISVEDASIAELSVSAMSPHSEREVSMPLRLPPVDGMAIVHAVLAVPGDAEARNDTLVTTIDLSAAAGVVFVSTSPDLDARFALGVLRGALALPTRGYFRVAPGEWRQDGTLAGVLEGEVREALRSAPLAVLHGDSMIFGSPRMATRGALALIAPPRERTRGGDWYAVSAPPSPLSASLAILPWDSLAPLDVAPAMPAGAWTALEVARARRLERRPAVAGVERPRRMIIVGAAGFWRWQFRGGVGAEAFATFWGSIFDWLAAGHRQARPVMADAGVVREGEPVRWRRGAGVDSALPVTLRRRGDTTGVDSMMLRFIGGATIAESPPLAAGTYDVVSPDGSTVLAVNPSVEWLPRRPVLRSGQVAGASPLGDVPTVRSRGWIYVLALVLLSLEWVARRRLGLR